ncbi:MAG: twin-arginine translocation signal domain-containing protein, partial [Steroidobacteraceae bacterium]
MAAKVATLNHPRGVEMDRRQFLAAGLAVGAVATDGARGSQAAVHDAGVEEAGILALQGRMEAGSLTSRELVGTYLA